MFTALMLFGIPYGKVIERLPSSLAFNDERSFFINMLGGLAVVALVMIIMVTMCLVYGMACLFIYLAVRWTVRRTL
jgi:hypothetical protein